jgi:hypothetical protein
MATMDTTNAGFGHGTASEPVVGRVLPTYLIGTACPTFCSDSHLASAGLTLRRPERSSSMAPWATSPWAWTAAPEHHGPANTDREPAALWINAHHSSFDERLAAGRREPLISRKADIIGWRRVRELGLLPRGRFDSGPDRDPHRTGFDARVRWTAGARCGLRQRRHGYAADGRRGRDGRGHREIQVGVLISSQRGKPV